MAIKLVEKTHAAAEVIKKITALVEDPVHAFDRGPRDGWLLPAKDERTLVVCDSEDGPVGIIHYGGSLNQIDVGWWLAKWPNSGA